MSLASEYVEKINALDDSERFDDVIEKHECAKVLDRELIDESRWSIRLRNVYSCPDDSYFEVTWDEPATEEQEGQDYNNVACLVEPREVTVTQYFEIKNQTDDPSKDGIGAWRQDDPENGGDIFHKTGLVNRPNGPWLSPYTGEYRTNEEMCGCHRIRVTFGVDDRN